MPESGKPAFRLIQVNEDEELVVHAGGGSRPVERGAAGPASSSAPDRGGFADPLPPEASQGTGDAGAPGPEEGGTASDPAETACRERLRRQAEDLAEAEAGLEGPRSLPKMQVTVIVALIALAIAFAVYFFFLKG